MPFNLPGSLVPLYALFNPRLLHPHICIAGDASLFILIRASRLTACGNSQIFASLTLLLSDVRDTVGLCSIRTTAWYVQITLPEATPVKILRLQTIPHEDKLVPELQVCLPANDISLPQ